ncbi:MAG: hypothetical protein ACXVLQ_12235 [Bacteriovorax sp.]
MKNLMAISMTALLASSCVSIQGNLHVAQNLSVNSKGGFLNTSSKHIDIAAGEYRAEFKKGLGGTYNIVVTKDGKEIKIPLKSKSNLNIPKYDGDFAISHNDINQYFDIKGSIGTDSQSSESYDQIESCTISRVVQNCHDNDYRSREDLRVEAPQDEEGRRGDQDRREHDSENNRREATPACRSDVISVPGTHEVRFHYTTTTKGLSFNILRPGTGVVIADFKGSDTKTERITERESECRVDRREDRDEREYGDRGEYRDSRGNGTRR